MPKESTKATITSFAGTPLVRVVDGSNSRNISPANLVAETGAQAALDGRYAPLDRLSIPGATGRVIWYPEHLKRWRAALGAARYGRASIVVMGDSITQGAYSNDVLTSAEATWRVRGWVPQLRSLFADRYGDPGEGAIWMGDTSRVSVSGGASNTPNSGSLGVFKTYALINGTTQVVTVNMPQCTTIRIHKWWAGASTGIPEYRVDGGSWTAADSSTGSDTLYFTEITGLSDATHTLEIRGEAAKNSYILGVEAIRSDTGVQVHRIAKSGAVLFDCLGSLFTDGDSLGGQRQARCAADIYNADLAVLAFSANNVTGGWSTHALDVAEVKAGAQNVVDYLVSLGMCVLLVGGPPRDPAAYASGVPGTQGEYDAAMREIARDNEHVSFLDISAVWGTHAAADDLGFFIDVVHPVMKGHGDIARTVFAALS